MTDGADSLALLRSEQAQLRTLAGELRALAERREPPPEAALSEARWAFARCLLRHLPHKNRLVYARLRLHRDPTVAALGQRYSDEAQSLYQLFERHSERWTPETVAAEWQTYRHGVLQLTRLLDDRITREESELLPHLATAPAVAAGRAPGDRNWAADGWKLRERLGVR